MKNSCWLLSPSGTLLQWLVGLHWLAASSPDYGFCCYTPVHDSVPFQKNPWAGSGLCRWLSMETKGIPELFMANP